MKLKFTEDKFYDGKLKFKKDQVYEVPEALGQAERWLKRGGIDVVQEEKAAKEHNAKEELRHKAKVEAAQKGGKKVEDNKKVEDKIPEENKAPETTVEKTETTVQEPAQDVVQNSATDGDSVTSSNESDAVNGL
jgi:hypothetical protein